MTDDETKEALSTTGIRANAFLRRCPKCDSFWWSRDEWLEDVKYDGMEFRTNSAAIWRIDIYAHDCGGQMYDEPTELSSFPSLCRDAFSVRRDCTGTAIFTPHCFPKRGPRAK